MKIQSISKISDNWPSISFHHCSLFIVYHSSKQPRHTPENPLSPLLFIVSASVRSGGLQK